MRACLRTILFVAQPPLRRAHSAARAAAAELPRRYLAPPALPEPGVACCVSHYEAIALHTALQPRRPDSASGSVSLGRGDLGALTVDLGLARPASAEVSASHVRLRGTRGIEGEEEWTACVPWAFLDRVARKRRAGVWQCYAPGQGEAEAAEEAEEDDLAPTKVEGLSELTSRPASLLPLDEASPTPPTAVLGGFNMHRTKGIDPAGDTDNKLRALGKKGGRVLDVCTGLGYTACAAARRAGVREVVTIELDPAMVELQRANPWSRQLFDDPKITRLLGDATEVLPALPEGYFDAAVHDPPANAMSGELYSLEVYRALRRLLRPGGVLFHYVGDPASKASGRLFKGVLQRLREAGFDAKTTPAAYGITAVAR